MKVTLEIDTEPHLTAEEIEAYKKLCESAQILPEVGIARCIRSEIQKARKSFKASARRRPSRKEVLS